MAQIISLSTDTRVNQQVLPISNNEIRVWFFINLKNKPDNTDSPDLSEVEFASCETFTADTKDVEEQGKYKDAMKNNGLDPKTKGSITIFKYRTTGEPIGADTCIPLPADRPYWVLTGLPHAVITKLSPTGDNNSTAKGEALSA